MHWLSDKLQDLESLLSRLNDYKNMDTTASDDAKETVKQTREVFTESVRELVSTVAIRDGITACFACHDGLLMQTSGQHPDFERLAVEGQKLINQGNVSSDRMDLGEFRQMLLIGGKEKVALFWMGEIGIGIVSEKDTVLLEQLQV